MNMVFKIVAFTFFLNLATGILSNPAIVGWNVGWDEDTDIYAISNFTSGLSADSSQLETDSDWAENLLGLLGLGFITEFLDFIKDYLFGIIDIVLYILPASTTAQTYIKSVLTLIISFIYTMGIVILFTGKRVNE